MTVTPSTEQTRRPEGEVLATASSIGTAAGIVPGTVSFVALGAFGTTPGSWPFVLSAAALIILTGGGLLVARKSRRDHSDAAAPVDSRRSRPRRSRSQDAEPLEHKG